MKDSDFLEWVRERMVNVYGENPLYDYIHRLDDIIVRLRSEGK